MDKPATLVIIDRVDFFRAALDLAPSKGFEPMSDFWKGCPDHDHTRLWYRPKALRDRWPSQGMYIVTTEPYTVERAKRVLGWAEAHNWGAGMLPGCGMWNPPSTSIVLLAKREVGPPRWIQNAYSAAETYRTKLEAAGQPVPRWALSGD